MYNQSNSHDFFKTVFNTTPVALAVIDVHGSFIEINEKFSSTFGYQTAELKDQSFLTIFSEKIQPEVASIQQQVFHSPQSALQSECKGKTKAGLLIDLQVSFNLLADENNARFMIASFNQASKEKNKVEAAENARLQYRSVIDNSMHGFFLTLPDGTILEANKAAEEIFGYSVEELCQIGRNGLVDQTDSRLQEKIKERNEKGFTNGELICIRKNGERFPIEFSSVFFRGENGEERTSTMFYDISERKRAEEQREFDRQNTEALINSTSDLIWSVSRDYKLIAANKAFSQSLDASYNMYLSPGDSVLAETLSPDVLKFWKGCYNRALAGETFTLELNVPQEDSIDDRWNEITFNPIVNNLEVIGVACRGRDITQKSIYHQKLITVNDQLETAQQIAKLGYWSNDLKSEVLFWSKEVYVIFGIQDPSFVLNFDTFFHHVHPDDRDEFLAQQKAALKGIAPLQHEHRIILFDGEIKYVIQKGTIVYNDAGEPIRIEGTVQDITDAKKAEHALKVNEEQLNLIYNSTAGIIFLLGVQNNGEDFYFISMNNAGLATIGLTEKDLVNKPVREIIPEPSFSLVLTKYREAIQTGKPVVWQEETPYPTGTKTGIVTVTPIYDNESNCIKLVGSVNDITELKQTERSLAISRQQYKSLFDQNSDAVFSLDLEGNFTNFNPGLEKLLECSRREIIQTGTFVPFCHPDDLQVALQHFLQVQTGDAQTYHVRAITFTGNLKYLSIINMPIVVDGNITGVYGIAKDITSEQLALNQLELSNERYEYATKATNDVIWDWNIITIKVIRAGSGFRNMFGYDEMDAVNDNLFWLKKIHPADVDEMIAKRQQALDDPKQDFWEDEYRFLRSNNEYAFVYERGYIFRNENGTAVRMIGATKDITEQKRYESQLKELNSQLEKRAAQLQVSNTELERFAYVASHDLQEPLRMISSFLQLLEKKYQDSIDEKGREYIHFAVDGSLRMKHLINELLNYSRVSTSKQHLEKVDTSLVMNDVLQNLSLQIKEKQAVIKADRLPCLPAADKTHMIQLFQNLLSNALKYSDKPQTQIDITAIEQEDEWLFSVKDNGIGFDEQFADKIFVIFHRLHNKIEYSGTGMGLAICKKIIDRHGGKIYAQSVPGQGSTFWFTIKKQLFPEQ